MGRVLTWSIRLRPTWSLLLARPLGKASDREFRRRVAVLMLEALRKTIRAE